MGVGKEGATGTPLFLAIAGQSRPSLASLQQEVIQIFHKKSRYSNRAVRQLL